MKQPCAPEAGLRAAALGYLSRREHSRRELAGKLLRQFPDAAAELDELLDGLQRQGYLSDERYAQGRVRTRSQRYGNARLAQELAASGVSRDAIHAALAGSGPEEERCRAVWERRFGPELPADMKERARQYRFLAYRGFSAAVIGRVLRGEDEPA